MMGISSPVTSSSNTRLSELYSVEHEPYLHFNLALTGLVHCKEKLIWLSWHWINERWWFDFAVRERKGLSKTNQQKTLKSNELSHVLRWFHNQYILIDVPQSTLYST